MALWKHLKNKAWKKQFKGSLQGKEAELPSVRDATLVGAANLAKTANLLFGLGQWLCFEPNLSVIVLDKF
jgi:hypothetical protein